MRMLVVYRSDKIWQIFTTGVGTQKPLTWQPKGIRFI